MKYKSLSISVIALLIVGVFAAYNASNSAVADGGTRVGVEQKASTGGIVYGHTDQDGFLGAASGPELPFDYLRVGGIKTSYRHTSSLNSASSTACQLRAPITASSTLATASGIYLSVSSTTATTITVAKAASSATAPVATTTVLQEFPVAAGAQVTWFASTSAPVFAPGEWLVFGMRGGADTGGSNKYSPVGVCEAAFSELN